jgi:serine/threonine protein phosphatase PrpC
VGVALSGDRAARVTVSLGAGAQLVAVAEGFGRIDGVPVANAALQRLRIAFERQRRTHRIARALCRRESAAALLSGAVARLNDEIYARGASHADFVSAGCSLTAVLIVRGYAIAAHLGATSASLTRDGRSRVLTPQHTVADLPIRLLTRALGAQSRCEASVSTFEIEDGDTLVLCDSANRRLIVRQFGRDDLEGVTWHRGSGWAALMARAGAAIGFVLAFLCVR